MTARNRINARAGGAVGIARAVALALCAAAALIPALATAQAVGLPTSSTAGWTNPANAYTDNGTYATATPAERGSTASDWGTFGFDGAIPSGATINSVTVEVQWRVDASGAGQTLSFQPLVNGAVQGAPASYTTIGTTDTISSSSQWTGLTRDNLLNSAFGVRVTAALANKGAAFTASLDYVKVTVDYTTPTPPPAPGTPGASGQTTTSMNVTWTPSTGATSYTLEVASDDAFASIVGTYTPATNAQAVSGLSSNTLYWMRASATGTGGTSSWSPTGLATTIPGAPGQPGFSGTTSSGTTVSWAAPSGNATITAYSLDRATDSGFTQNLVTTPVGASTSTPVTGLAASTTYWFRVRATNAAGMSASSTPSFITTSASAQTLLATGSDPSASAPLCPGGDAAYVGQFVFSSDPTADTVAALDVALGAGASAAVALVELRDASGASLTPLRTEVPAGDTVTFGAALLPSPTAGATYRLYVTPKLHSLTAAGSYSVAARVASFTPATHPAQGADSASTFTIDNAPPASATWGAVTPGSGQIELAWTNPGADSGAAVSHVIVLRRRTASAFTETLEDGTTPPGLGSKTSGGSDVVYSQAGAAGAPGTLVDTGLLDGVAYVYRVYVLDACGNWNAGASSGPHVPAGAFRAEGSTVAGAPMVSIVNPLKGSTVSGAFRVQIRVFNAVAQGGIAGLTAGSLAYSTDDGATWQTSGLTPLSGFDTWSSGGTLVGRTWEVQLAPGVAGPYALRAKVSNAVAADVLSNAVSIRFRTSGGSGTLLVRDNSSQLCSDCHSLMGHTSETTDGARGSWSTTCRDCHTPHGTKNVALVAEEITPPAIAAPQAPKPVVFYNKAGNADASFASDAANGPCQVCHTRTVYYLADGTGADHYTTPCMTCHKHSQRFSASCTGCHGTEGRTSVAGADQRQEAAPPVVAPDALVFSVDGGAHLAHVNQVTWRGAPLRCAHCHPSPNVHQTDLGQPSQTDVEWTGLASTGGVTPAPAAGALAGTWPGSPGCTNYCHGASLARAGGSNRNPGWIGGPAQAACGTCHAVLPPVGGASAGVHPQNEACASCHGAGYGFAAGAGSLADPAKAKHVDGTLDRPNGCTACHGNLTGTSGVVVASGDAQAAPGWDSLSVDTRGSTDRADVGVGAHGKHVNAGMMTAKACGVCHGSTPVDGDEVHANAAVTIGWSAPATAKSVTPTWSSPTCTNYCHSSGLPIGGAVAKVTATWTSTAALGCGDCHAATPPTNAHAKHATAYGVGCRACHAATAATSASIVSGGGAHVSGGNDVGFDAGDAYVADAAYDTGGYTCASTYCHSNGTDRDPAGGFAANTSRAWNAGGGGCASCHEAGTALASGSHPAHVNQAGTYATTFGCQTCHASTTADGSTIASTVLHVNMAADVTPAGALNYASGACSTYCHSSGQGGAATPQYYADMAWGTPLANDCRQCHGRYSPADPGFASSFGAPNYASGGAAAATANSHKAHVSSAGDCYVCHKDTVNAAGDAILSGASHLDGNRQVAFDATKAGASATYSNDAAKRCSNVACHGAGQPQWGGPAQRCDSCHFGTSDQDDFVSISNDSASAISSGEWAAVGHGQTTADFGEFGGTTDRCVYCHDSQNASANHKQSGNPFRLRGASDAAGATALYSTASDLSVIAACLNCHATSGANGVDPDGAGGQPKVGPATKRIDAYHYGATDHDATRNGGKRCWDCHDPHGDGANLAMIGADTLRAATDPHGFAGTRSTNAAVLTTRAAGGYANTTTRDGICQVCHTTTDYWRFASEPTAHNPGTDCVACHSHQQAPNNAFQGAGACSACHLGVAAAGVPNDRDEFPPVYDGGGGKSLVDREDWAATGHGLPAASAYASGNPGAGFPSTATAEGCYYCHAPDTALWASGESSKHEDVATTNPFRLLNTSGGANKNGVCLVCHAPSSPGFDPDGAAKLDFASLNRTTSRAISAAHYGAGHAAGDGGGLCWDCHDPHGDWNYANARGIAYMVQAQPTMAASDAWGATISVTANVVDFDKGLGVDAAAFDGGDYVRTASPYTGVCQVCHTSTAHWTSTATDTHQNGAARCVSCHAHEQTPNLAFRQVSPASCSTCHPNPPGGGRHVAHLSAAPSTTYGDTTIRSTPTEYDFGCGKCHGTTGHMDDQGGTAADPYRAGVAFDLNNGSAATYAPAGGVSTETGSTTPPLAFGWQNGTCSNTYCHDPLGASYAGKTAVAWGTTATLACTACHDDANGQATTALPGAHDKHATSAAGAYDFVCQKCHANTVDAAGALLTAAGQGKVQHVDGDKDDVRFSTVGAIDQSGGTFTGGLTGTCASTYCHSDGKLQAPPFNAPTNPSLQWGQTGSCTSCHAGGGGASTALSGAHFRHVDAAANDGYAYGCERCHSATWNGTAITVAQHVDGDVAGDVRFNSVPVNQTAATYASGAKTCGSTYCHSDGKTTTAPYGSSNSIAWTAAGGCDRCHGFGGGASTALSAAHGKHVNATANGYAYACDRCHANTASGNAISTAGKAQHVDADTTTHDVAFGTSPLDQRAGSYATAGQTCSATYCHSNGTDRVAPFTSGASIAWTTTNGDCTGCHGGNVASAAVLATNAHGSHVANTTSSTYIQANVACATCHTSTVSADRTILNPGGYTAHVNGAAEAAGYTDGTADGVANGACASTYCHSSGSGTVQYYSVAWNGTLANDCKQCHGRYSPAAFTTVAGEPNYATGTAGSATANSHQKHVDAAADCYTCHTTSVSAAGNLVPAAAAAHLDGNPDVSLNTSSAAVGASATYTPGTGNKTCSNVVCHGGTGSSVQWGATNVTCRTCHMKSGAGDLDTDDYTYGNNVVAALDQEDWLAYGHGATAAYAQSANPRANFDNSGATAVDGCLYCHDVAANGGANHGDANNPFRLKNTGGAGGKIGVCLVCHETGSAGVSVGGVARNRTTSLAISSTHYGAGHTGAGTGGGQYCWDCHDPHGDYNYGATQQLAFMLQELPVMNHATTTGTTDWGVPTATAPTPDFRFNRDGAGSAGTFAWGDYVSNVLASGTYRGVCQVCHTSTANVAYFRQTLYTANHNNTGTPACTAACHLHEQPATNAFRGKGSCLGCHGTVAQDDAGVTGSRRAVTADFSKNSHHVGNGSATMGGTLTDNDCSVCHAEAEVASQGAEPTLSPLHKNGLVDLRNADDATSYFQYDVNTIKTAGTAAANSNNATWRSETSGRTNESIGDPTVACSGTIPGGYTCNKGLDRFCISCHDADGASASSAMGDAAATAANPFGDTRVSNEVDQQIRCATPPCTAPGTVVDVASRVHVTARTAAGGNATATDRDSGYAPAGVTVRGADTRTDPPEGVFSRHAIRGLSVSVYGTTNANLDGATQAVGTNGSYWNRQRVAWSSTSVMGCADCHTVDGANTTSGNAHGSNSEYLLKDASGTATEGTSNTTYVCAQCHLATNYAGGTHLAMSSNGGNCPTDSTAATGSARVTSDGNIYGYFCGSCHGGGAQSVSGSTFPTGSTGVYGFGTIHGTSQVFASVSATGTKRPAYRFTNGNSMRYYNYGNWTSTASARTCYTIGSSEADMWGSCVQHTGGRGATIQTSMQRPLSY